MNYFRLLIVSTTILYFAVFTPFEELRAQSIEFGVTAGGNISTHYHNFRYQEDDINLNLDPKIKAGYQAGILARTDISRIIRVQAEPSIAMLGARYDESFILREFEFQTKSRTNLLYLQIPVVLQFSTIPSETTVYGLPFKKTTYHISGGFVAGRMLDAQFTGTNTGVPIGIEFRGDFSNDVTDQHPKYDFGTLLGVGVEHGESNKIGFETRGVFTWDTANHTLDPQNLAIMFAVYYVF